MGLIKYNVKQFIRDRIWFGWAWTDLCLKHWNYRTSCETCQHGEWVNVLKPQITYVEPSMSVSETWLTLVFIYLNEHKFGRYRIIKVSKIVPEWFIEND